MRVQSGHLAISIITVLVCLFAPAITVQAGTIIVRADGGGDFPTIQAAIYTAANGDTVQLENGTYTGAGNRDVDFKGKSITVRGNLIDPHLVVIDCQGTEAQPHRGFNFISYEGVSSVLEGLTIKNGYGPIWFSSSTGGGIYISNSSPFIKNCIITNCRTSASGGGGGIYCTGTNTPIIEFCTITGNSSGWGGGIYGCAGTIANCTISGNTVRYCGGGFTHCNGTIRNCTVENNLAYGSGGGFDFSDGNITSCTVSGNSAGDGGGFNWCHGIISKCTISDNSAVQNGGGLKSCDGTITNCTVNDNDASSGGGFYLCNGTITNCTVGNNSATENGGGFYNGNGQIKNSIVWGNIAGSYDQIYSSAAPSYSCIENWSGGGVGNISTDPVFVNAEGCDYHSKSQYGRWNSASMHWVQDDVTSPCIDAGDPADLGWQNELWPHGGRINMGAYGGTPEASMSPDPVGNIADLNHDNAVDLSDWSLWSYDWLKQRPLLDSDLDRDSTVDANDRSILTDNWLFGIE